MSNIFRFDHLRFAVQMLIVMLRQPAMIAFLEAIAIGVSEIYGLFISNRYSNINQLTITPQVCFLEKALNDRFDSTNRRLFITDGYFYDELYIFTNDEAQDEYLFTESENENIYMYTSSESGSESADFIVNVPSVVKFNEPEMVAIINLYKLVSKTFKINII